MSLEYFIPFRLVDVVAMCADDLPADERSAFHNLTTVLSGLVHHRFDRHIERIKDAYAPFDADADTRAGAPLSPAERVAARRRVEEELIWLATEANFTRIDSDDLAEAFHDHALLKVRMGVDTEPIETRLLFRRGESTRTEEERRWFGLRRVPVTYTNFGRVLVYTSFRDDAPTSGQIRPGSIVVKLFRDVARDDLEMVLPGVNVQMRLIDKLLIGVPAVASGAVVVATKLISAIILIALLFGFWVGLREHAPNINRTALVTIIGGLVAVGGYLFRQVTKFKNRKIRFIKALSETLYFHNLDNDIGVFYHVLDEAEESELKETVLAYHHLRMAASPRTPAELDKDIEEWFDTRGTRFNFDISDGVRNLIDYGLVSRDSDGRLRAVGLKAGRQRLDQAWDAVFEEAREPAARPT